MRTCACKRKEGLRNSSWDTCVLNRWPQTNVLEYFLSTGMAKYTIASPPARKMSLISSIIIAIILSCALIRIYIILHIFCMSLKLRGWQNCIEWLDRVYQRKLIQYTSTEYHLCFQGCSFKNPNVLLKIRMFLISRLHK